MCRHIQTVLISLSLILISVSCGNRNNNTNNESSQYSDSLRSEEKLIVIINEDGTTNGNHVYAPVDDNSFYLDYVQYAIVQSHIDVVAYDLAGLEGNVKIPNSININNISYEVLRIGEGAFYGSGHMNSITIPSSVKIIRNSAFQTCRLTNVHLSNGLKSIGENAFGGCRKLSSITIPSSVDNIENDAFGFCESMESIVVDEQNEKYDSRNKCNAIIETTTNTLIRGCKATVIPNDIEIIGEGAFSGAKGLTSIEIPSSVVSIKKHAFFCCHDMKSIKIPNTVKEIGASAFYGCSNLESVTIPDNVAEIDGLFEGCTNLSTVTFGSGVTRVFGEETFKGCPNLRKIIIKATTPPTYAAFNMMDVEPRDVELHVPMEAVEKYENARGWKDFMIVGD